MNFGQRVRVTDLTLHTWAPAQSSVHRAIVSLEDLWRVRASGLPTPTVDNLQIVSAMAGGILIGLSAATLLSDPFVFTSSFVVSLLTLAMLQVLLQQRVMSQQREEGLPQQDSEPLDQEQRQDQPSIMTSFTDEESMIPLLEDVLRHLHDYSYLGQHPLAQLQSFKRQRQLCSGATGFNSHLEVGRALQTYLVNMIGKLRPTGQLPSRTVIPSREWHAYIILDARYVQGELTREIIAWLYIGEGTYSRIRRRAVHSIARTLVEIEHQTRAETACHRIAKHG